MAETTGIEWCDHTWNPWWGCQAVSEACAHCYAEKLDHRLGGAHFGPGAPRRRTSAANWAEPLKWNRRAETDGVVRSVLACSMADWFDNAVDPSWRAEAWDVVRATPALRYLILTERPQNIEEMLPQEWGNGWPNVWLGTTVENQAEANRRIPHLLAVPAAGHFLSCEPLLGPVRLDHVTNRRGFDSCLEWQEIHGGTGQVVDWKPRIDWVIAGGESGPGARPMHPDWSRSLRDQCAEAEVPFFFKQWGEWSPADDSGRRFSLVGPDGVARGAHSGVWHSAPMSFVGKKAAGRLLDGALLHAFPWRSGE